MDIRIVVANDASTDGTADAVRDLDDVTLVNLPVNGGPAAARNAALDVVDTDWCLVLDADDTLEPRHTQDLIAQARASDLDIVLANFRRVTVEGEPMGDAAHIDPAFARELGVLSVDPYLAGNLISKSSGNLGYLKPLMRIATVRSKGLRYNAALRNSEDTNFVLEALLKGARVQISPEATYLYTVRPGSISHRIAFDHVEALMREERALAQKWSEALSPRAKQLLDTRWLRLSDMLEGERVIADLRSRKFGQALGQILKRPRTASRVARQIAEGVTRRAIGR